MKKIYFLYGLMILSFNSCSKKEAQLPIIDIEGIHEIQNHSSVWVFFETKGQDTLAKLNKNNKLLNSHWIYNIDKRLTMHHIVPLLQKMQKNRNKDSMHKKEGMLNYFSYADVSSNNISLIKFDPTKYIYTENEYKSVLDKLTAYRLMEIEFDNNNIFINHIECFPSQLIPKIEESIGNDSLSKLQIILKYNKNTSYQNYLHAKAILSKTNVKINDMEYIFN